MFCYKTCLLILDTTSVFESLSSSDKLSDDNVQTHIEIDTYDISEIDKSGPSSSKKIEEHVNL